MTAVIFDLDGTLVDSAPDIHAAINRTLLDLGAEALSLAQVTSFIGNGVPALIARVIVARSLPQPAKAIEAAFLHHYHRDAATLTTLYPHVSEALARLSSEGFVLGVCTNKPEAPARNVLQAFGLERFFAVVIGGDTLAFRKPDPAPLLAAAAQIGRPQAIFVGDSEVDAETAERANIPFVLFTEGYRNLPLNELRHQASFSDYRLLPELVSGLQTKA